MADRSAAADKQPHPIYSDRWADGTVRAGFPGPALRHGLHAYQHRGLPEDLRLSIEDSRRGVIADQGGADALTTLQAGYIARLCDVDVAIRLLQNDLIQRGMFTGRGRVRSTFGRLLETIDRWDRLAQRLGVERRARQLPSIQQYLEQTITANATEASESTGQ